MERGERDGMATHWTLYVTPEGAYANRLFRPECDRSRMICQWLRQKTLSPRDIECLKQLNFEIKIKEKVL